MHARAFKVASVLVLSACASAGGGTGGGNPNLITREQIEAQGTQQEDSYALIQRIRPSWLRARGSSIQTGERLYAVVFLNGSRYGPLDELRSFRTSSVETLEYISATEATTRFGTGYMGGVIMVRTR